MSFLDKLLPKRREERFIPHCRVKPDETMECNAEWTRKDGIVEVTKEPVITRIVGGKAEIIDTGGASEGVIRKLRQHIEENTMGK